MKSENMLYAALLLVMAVGSMNSFAAEHSAACVYDQPNGPVIRVR